MNSRVGDGLKYSLPVAPRDVLPKSVSNNALYLQNDLVLNSSSGAVNASLSFSDDSNANAIVTMYYCNQTDAPNCDPSAGFSVLMSRGASSYTATTGALVSPNDIGDKLKILIRASDSDGGYGEYLRVIPIQ